MPLPSPLISVIVPIYNMEPLLPRCLDSLAAQTLRDLEIICNAFIEVLQGVYHPRIAYPEKDSQAQ